MNRSVRAAVALLPIFRLQAQYRLVGELFTNPGREFVIGELALVVNASHATVAREVTRLEEAGLLRSHGEGRRRLVAAQRNTPVFEPLRDLMAKVYGVPAIVAEEFRFPGAKVAIFGSWAARWAGRPGPVPRDVDVLVVGDVDPTEAWEAAAAATGRLGMEVDVVVRTAAEWEDDPTGFAEQVKTSPLIELTGALPETRSDAGSGGTAGVAGGA